MIKESVFEESNLRIGYIIFFVTAVGFVCSLTYNHGYFWICPAGMNVLSIGDILTSYTLWVPSIGTLLFGYGLDMFLKHIEDKEKSKRIKKILKHLLSMPQTVILMVILLALCWYVIFSLPYIPLLVWSILALIWLKISGHLLASKIFTGRTNKFILGVFLFIPVILSLMFTIGLDHAIQDSKLATANAFVTPKHPYSKTAPIIVLRHLEKGLLAKDVINNNYIVYIWEDISKIEVISNNMSIKGI